MKRGLKSSGVPAGFTIVETMIVLAVTGLLFATIAVGFAGRQQNAAFHSAIGDIRSQIQQTINDVANGYFPSSGTFTCTASAGTVTIGTGSASQGTNSGCVFLGKVMQFGASGDPQPFYIHSVAGLRSTGYKPMNQLYPTYVPAIKETKQLGGGLTFAKMTYNGGQISSVGFLYSLGKADSEGSGYANGSVQVDVYAIKDTNFGVGGKMTDYSLVDSGVVQICFQGGNGKWGKITVGGKQGTSATSLQIMDQSNSNCGL